MKKYPEILKKDLSKTIIEVANYNSMLTLKRNFLLDYLSGIIYGTYEFFCNDLNYYVQEIPSNELNAFRKDLSMIRMHAIILHDMLDFFGGRNIQLETLRFWLEEIAEKSKNQLKKLKHKK